MHKVYATQYLQAEPDGCMLRMFSMFATFLAATLYVAASAVPQDTATQLDAQTITARVAAHQDRSETERTHFVYVQRTRVTSRKGKTIRCKQNTDSRVTPSTTGSHQELLKLDGRLLVRSNTNSRFRFACGHGGPQQEVDPQSLRSGHRGPGQGQRSRLPYLRGRAYNQKLSVQVAAT